jgi:hypothetical protein
VNVVGTLLEHKEICIGKKFEGFRPRALFLRNARGPGLDPLHHL